MLERKNSKFYNQNIRNMIKLSEKSALAHIQWMTLDTNVQNSVWDILERVEKKMIILTN